MINQSSCCYTQPRPSAHITVKKGRLKIYFQEKKVDHYSRSVTNACQCHYMQHGQEFEIELFNPTNICQLAKIEINGKFISNSGVCLRPGERVFLERYIDKPNKFKFDIYDVEAGSNIVDKAISNNGDIKIYFYAEQTLYNTNSNLYTGSLNILSNLILDLPTTPVNGDSVFFSTSGTSNFNWSSLSGSLNCTNSCDTTKLNSNTLSDDFSDDLLNITKETGRIEEGSSSKQNFDNINKNFTYVTDNVISFKILPLSEKIITADEIKKFCTECGKNLKPNFKFCPSCGTKA
jgi:hypothetical protein